MNDLLAKIRKEYAPYDTHAAFAEGFAAYQQGIEKNPYDDGNLDVELGEAGQAWERGFEAAVRCGGLTQ